MTTYKAISSGNADTLGIWETWNGAAWVAAGSLPTTTDDVYANGFIITVTTSQSYLSWNRSSVAAPLSIAQGGQFQIDGGNAITTQGLIDGFRNTNGVSYTTGACVLRLATHTAKWTHIGDMKGGQLNYGIGATNSSTANIEIIGNQFGNNVNYGNASVGLYNAASCNILVTGNQYAGNNIDNYGIQNVANGAIFNIIGNQIALNTYAFINSATLVSATFLGNAYASATKAAIYNSQLTSYIIYQGNAYNKLSQVAIFSNNIFLNVTPTTVWEFSDFDGDTQYLYGAGVNTGHPIEADVRKDTVYGPNDEFEGTCAIPPPATVNLGVPTDNTTGTGTTGLVSDIITRLANCATIEQVASLIKNLK